MENRKCKVSIYMCEKETGGFVAGISRSGIFSEKEVAESKYNELIKDIQMKDGCYWSFTFNWLK